MLQSPGCKFWISEAFWRWGGWWRTVQCYILCSYRWGGPYTHTTKAPSLHRLIAPSLGVLLLPFKTLTFLEELLPYCTVASMVECSTSEHTILFVLEQLFVLESFSETLMLKIRQTLNPLHRHLYISGNNNLCARWAREHHSFLCSSTMFNRICTPPHPHSRAQTLCYLQF